MPQAHPVRSFVRSLNPRRHLSAAIGWAVFLVVSLAALVTANLAAGEAEARARADTEGLLSEFATQTRDALSLQLEARRALLKGLAAQLPGGHDPDLRAAHGALNATRAQFPEFRALGWLDARGQTRLAVGEGAALVPEADVATRPKASDTSDTSGTSDASDASETAAAMREGRTRIRFGVGPRNTGRDAVRLPQRIDMVVPLPDDPPGRGGAVVASLDWSWVEHLLRSMQSVLSQHRDIDLMLIDRDGRLLFASRDAPAPGAMPPGDLTEGGRFVVGQRGQLRLAGGLGLGWTTVVRQPACEAMEAVRQMRQTVFLVVFLAGLLSATAAAGVAHLLTRRLTRLAADADAIRRGERRSFATPLGQDEVAQIGVTLAQVVDHVQEEKQALQRLNVELDQRVAERTRRIEHMAVEARQAAVTRERLRIARDLHDTLAHSLMALLTQVRLVRKLRSRFDPVELDQELGRAEDVAATGLAEARAAITQIRGHGVRDTGLGQALHDLARRFAEKTGLTLTLAVDPAADSWIDERAETVFRIAEEALRNVQHHAGPCQVRVALVWCGAAVPATEARARFEVEVSDDGAGFDPDQPHTGHHGLRGMREQAALIDARLVIDSQPGAGTRVRLAFEL
ncbi:MAG: histidine kinase [Leptothrix sp. (in: b-proteobacteria)]